MSFGVAAGTLFAITAGVPATFNVAGYAALSWTNVGEVTDVGEFGAVWSNSTGNQLATRGTQKKKTTRDPGNLDLTLNLDTDDAGQILMKAARDSATAIYAARVTEPNGDIYYCQVLVNTFKVGGQNQAGKTTATTSCAVTTSSTDVDWVESLAA